MRDWGVLGVPSSAGGHTPGMDLAPAAIRAAGLVDGLIAAGDHVVDEGDVRGFRWRPDHDHPDRQNIAEVGRVAADTAASVERIVEAGRTPLVIGGDCTVTIGAVAGFRRLGTVPALLYFDGGPDLFTPGRTEYGNVDGMGLAHMLALPGCDPQLSTVVGDPPLLDPSEVVSYGDALPETGNDIEHVLLENLRIARVSAAEIHAGCAEAALRARHLVEQAAERFIVHFDVDVLGHGEMPLANMPNPDAEPWGLRVDEVITSLQTFSRSPRFAGIVLTEVNPGNAPDASTMTDYVTMVVQGLTAPLESTEVGR
jgi:arginase